MSATIVKCGWRNCDIELTNGRYCTPSHKNKSRAARNKKPSAPERVAEHVWKLSGFTFAKSMEGSERIASAHLADPESVKTIMMHALRKRIDNYFAELDA